MIRLKIHPEWASNRVCESVWKLVSEHAEEMKWLTESNEKWPEHPAFATSCGCSDANLTKPNLVSLIVLKQYSLSIQMNTFET